MNISPSKENILKKIRKALTTSTPLPFPLADKPENVFHPLQQEIEVEFAEQFIQLQGKFIFCRNAQELAFQLNSLIRKQGWQKIYCNEQRFINVFDEGLTSLLTSEDLAGCDAAVTGCDALVARTGSIVLSASAPSGRTASIYAPVHICIARASQLVYDIQDALKLMVEKYGDQLPSLITFATGPSRTADIEKTLVVGVHGPGEVYCFLVDE